MAETNDLIIDEMSEKIIEIAEKMATEDGAHTVTVRKIINELGVTNRVFYNRFHNVNEVLECVYKNAVMKMHESLKSEHDVKKDFFEYVMDVVINVLVNTYEIKRQFNRYMFEHDSLTEYNYQWWKKEITKLVKYAVEQKLIKEVDPDMLSYSVWCFCRGFNADAVSRNLSVEEAVKMFRFGFGCFLDGLKI